MGNRSIHWQGNIAINILLLLLLLLLLLSLLLLGYIVYLVGPPAIEASEDQGTAEFLLDIADNGYMAQFPVYLR